MAENSKGRPGQVDEYVAARIKERRVMLGLTQGDLAERLGVSFQQVQKYEKGSNRISAGRLYILAMTLDVPLDYFFVTTSGDAAFEVDGLGIKPVAAPPMTDGFSKQASLMVRRFSQISDKSVRRNVLGLVIALAKAERNG